MDEQQGAQQHHHQENLAKQQANIQQASSGSNQVSSSQTSGASAPSQPASPRRRKPALNLDAALYLQSQARDVQEPNEKHAAAACVTSKSFDGRQELATPTLVSPSHAPSCQQCPNRCGRKKQQQQQQLDLRAPQAISVDYIDCVSIDDLNLQAASSSMRGCRKHLRFHRNRVEPAATSATAEPLEPASQLACAQFNDAATTTTSAADSLSNVLSSTCSDSNEQAARQNQPSVLYPISVSEVKKRTYFIGSIAQDALLGHDELYRYFPHGRVNIFVSTWNQNRRRAPMNLSELLLPEQLVHMPDIYAIGIQEAFSSQADYLREWEIQLQITLGPSHVLLHSCSLGVLHLSVFVRRDLIWFCSTPEESVYNSRSMPTNMIKTKGAVSIAFRFFGTSFMFTNCHFPAHENKLKDRVDEYQRIINSIDLPKNLKLLKPRYLSNDSTARFDCVFFMGDLNFRLEQRTFDETIQILDDIFHKQKDELHLQAAQQSPFEPLTQNDELLKVMESNQAFHGFDESQIKFPPTYKFLAQTNKYDRQTKRVPSYTDRILFRSKRQRHIQCLIYDWLPQLLSSDHKPVFCLFDVLVRPGLEQHNLVGSLNAGLFQRSVYLEALKRRAEDPETMRAENGTGGNLICSIS